MKNKLFLVIALIQNKLFLVIALIPWRPWLPDSLGLVIRKFLSSSYVLSGFEPALLLGSLPPYPFGHKGCRDSGTIFGSFIFSRWGGEVRGREIESTHWNKQGDTHGFCYLKKKKE